MNTNGKAARQSNLSNMNVVGGCKFQIINEDTMKWETLGTDAYTPKHINDFMKKNNLKWVWVNFLGQHEMWTATNSTLAKQSK